MRKSKLKQEDVRDWQEARTLALMSEDPTLYIEVGGAETELCDTMEAVYQYIKSVLYMDDNPLRYLRKYFHDFEWKFYKVDKLEKLAPIIANADYIWSSDDYIFCSEGIVVASRKFRKTAKVLLYRPDVPEHSEPHRENENLKLARLIPSIRFVYGENGVGTVIK